MDEPKSNDVQNNARSESASDPAAAPNFAVVEEPSYTHTLFLGPDGLRPGWGFVFYVAMFFPLSRLASALGDWWHFGSASWLWAMMVEELGDFLAAVVPAVLLSRIEHRPWGTYGLPLHRAFGRLFWVGAVWGFAGISLLLGSLYGAHAFSFGHLALHGVRIVKFAVFWAVMFLLVGLFEEFLLRGYAQFTLTRGIGFWPAALALSCLFGLIHVGNGGESWPGLLAVVIIGLFFCLTLRRTGNLWFAVGFHAAWDWGETFFYSVPDSGTVFPGHLLQSSLSGPRWLTGGTVGPEGSVLCFMVIGAVALLFERRYREVKYRA
jgi:membrane protease YdiL (CAAX protease family)